MEKLYTIHLTDWLGENKPAIIENETGLQYDSSYKGVSRFYDGYYKDKEFLSKFEIVFDVPGEPNPIPYFVSEYKLSLNRGFLGVLHLVITPMLTEQGVLRRAWEQGERLEEARKHGLKRYTTPFGFMYR